MTVDPESLKKDSEVPLPPYVPKGNTKKSKSKVSNYQNTCYLKYLTKCLQ